jgi:ComF family protein
MQIRSAIKQLTYAMLVFALPPRCAGCGMIVEQVHSFCTDCWKQIEFLGSAGCVVCGTPLEATDAERCASCLAKPPRIVRTRAAVVYNDLSRGLALRLKYGRKVAVAKTMARYMAPLVGEHPEGALLIPVPLHRGRLWQRGFNQSAIIASELARRTGLDSNVVALRRIKRTPPLKGMSEQQRRRAVAGAFKVGDGAAVDGRTIVLVDDVLTTGSTANACARALRRAGAARVELISWARVVRPARLMR